MSKRHYSENSGPSQRQLRVGELIRRTISDVLNRGDIYDADIAHMSITVGEVRTSTDLRVATIYVMPLGGQDVELAITALNRCKGELRRQVNKAISLKFSPELRFEADRTFDQMDETRRLLALGDVVRDVAAVDKDADEGADD